MRMLGGIKNMLALGVVGGGAPPVTYSISGTVTDVIISTISGVTVSLGAYSAVSGVDGTYQIDGIPAGTNGTLTATLDGCTFTTIAISPMTENLIGQDIASIIRITNPKFTTDTAGWTGVGADLAAVDAGPNPKYLTITNNATGNGRASQQLTLPAGTYTLGFQHINGTTTSHVSLSVLSGGWDVYVGEVNDVTMTLKTYSVTTAFDNPFINFINASDVNGQVGIIDEVTVVVP